MRLILSIITVLSFTTVCNGQSYFEEKLRAAQKGDSDAMISIGIEYTYFKKDERAALEWYKKAADLGNPLAYQIIGEIYQWGNTIIRPNKEESYYWYRKALFSDISDKNRGQINFSCAKVCNDKELSIHHFKASADFGYRQEYQNGEVHDPIIELRSIGIDYTPFSISLPSGRYRAKYTTLTKDDYESFNWSNGTDYESENYYVLVNGSQIYFVNFLENGYVKIVGSDETTSLGTRYIINNGATITVQQDIIGQTKLIAYHNKLIHIISWN